MAYNRQQIADLILEKIKSEQSNILRQYQTSKNEIGYFYVDDLLPIELANQIYDNFPTEDQMVLKKSLREDKYIGVQMDNYHILLEDCIYAFHDHRIVDFIADICQIKNVYADDKLYAGGISLMKQQQFLQPHLDNSHDKDRSRWRVLNLLFYVTPNWQLENGGNLELWPNGLDAHPVTIVSKFNRLAVMATHNASLHSVSPIIANLKRRCISNYYFSDFPLQETDTFHVTSFRGRPDQKIKDLILQTDNFLRMTIRKIFKKGIVENRHFYKKNKQS